MTDGIKGLKLRDEETPLSRGLSRIDPNGHRNAGGTRTSVPLCDLDGRFENSRFDGLLFAIMETMGLDEIRVNKKLFQEKRRRIRIVATIDDLTRGEYVFRRNK